MHSAFPGIYRSITSADGEMIENGSLRCAV